MAYPLLNPLPKDRTMKTIELIEPQQHGVKGETIVELPFGLLGFEHVKNYVLLTRPHEEPFRWLQMLDNAGRGFLVVPPFHVMPDYQPDITAEDVEFLGLAQPADALVLNIVTLHGNSQATVNLKGPVVINRHTLIGKQVIPNNVAQFDLRHPLPVS
jgi:flagellar assembly factor FliW